MLDDADPIADDRPADRPPAPGRRHARCATGSTDALEDLPPKLRPVVVLRDVYDLPHEAIAAELGISESAAKVRLHRARKKLREDLFPRHVRRRPPMRCDELADDLAAAADGSVLLGRDRAPPRRALPALPGRARAVPQAAAGAARPAHRGARAGARACWPTSSPASRTPASATPSGRMLPGRRVAYVGGIAAATAAGAAGAVFFASGPQHAPQAAQLAVLADRLTATLAGARQPALRSG